MPETITIRGLDELQKTLEELPADVSKKVMREPLTAAAAEMREAMFAMAPKDTGFMAEHFNAKFRISGKNTEGHAFIGPAGRVYYPNRGSKEAGTATGRRPRRGGLVPVVSVARFLEFGTSRMKPRPFMRPAFEAHKESVMNVIVQGIRDALAKWAK